MAERVGFAPLLMLKTKNLRGSTFLTIRRLRSNARVKTRIEHAEESLIQPHNGIRFLLGSPLSLKNLAALIYRP